MRTAFGQGSKPPEWTDAEMRAFHADKCTALAANARALWAVVDGIARGWRIEDRSRIYDEVARGLGGTYENAPGSLAGRFVGLRKRM